ncbi:MAG TPA: redoxin domain-containing protein, partial [Pirellulales bacterium]|nr:redoxin domain-containing protein [Pirellulales bacterium]
MSDLFGPRSGRCFPLAAALFFAGLSLFASGCAQKTEAKPHTQDRKPPPTPAMEVLDRMVEAYHQADRYQDDGRLLVRYTYDGQEVTETKEFSLAIAAPNRIRLRAYDALVVCDGQNLRGTIDESPEEVFSMPAPDELSAGSPYQDSVLGKALNQIVGSVPVTLFLDPDPLPLLLVNAHAPRLEPSQRIGDDECYRVRIERREGAFVLWIDQQTLVLRRVEYPTEGYRRLIEPYPGVIRDMTITAELENARLDPPIDDSTFEFKVPPGASVVRRFDDVRVGARIPKFTLRTLDGQTITRDSLEGKTAVLKFWQKDDLLAYYNDLSTFAQIQQRYASDDSIVFLAVTADPDDVSDDGLQSALAKAELTLPIARADYRVAFRSFGLQIVPTTVILGRDGTLQERVVGVYPKQATALVKKIDILLAGGDLTLEAHEEPPEEYSFSGFDWQIAPDPAEERQAAMAAALDKAEVAPASEPMRLRRKRLWTCSELQQPGNIIVVPDDAGGDRVLVIEGWPSVAEIGPGGKLSARHRLKLPQRDDAAVAFLRTATDADGNRYFVGSRAGSQQLHLFDDHWKRLLSFPEFADHPGISDALLADLDGD